MSDAFERPVCNAPNNIKNIILFGKFSSYIIPFDELVIRNCISIRASEGLKEAGMYFL